MIGVHNLYVAAGRRQAPAPKPVFDTILMQILDLVRCSRSAAVRMGASSRQTAREPLSGDGIPVRVARCWTHLTHVDCDAAEDRASGAHTALTRPNPSVGAGLTVLTEVARRTQIHQPGSKRPAHAGPRYVYRLEEPLLTLSVGVRHRSGTVHASHLSAPRRHEVTTH